MSTVTRLRRERATGWPAEVAANIRAEAARLGWSQGDLAQGLGMSQSAVAIRWWGERQWQLEDIAKAAHLFGVRPVDLCAARDSNPEPSDYDLTAAYRRALLAADDRDALMLRLAAEVGMRRGEVARVHARDLLDDVLGVSLLVHGKGGRDRVLPLPDGLAIALRVRCAGGWAFPGRDQGHLSPAYVGRRVSALMPQGVSMHSLRHRFATRAHAVDRDLVTVQRLLGHASPETTVRYVQTGDEGLRRTVLAAAG